MRSRLLHPLAERRHARRTRGRRRTAQDAERGSAPQSQHAPAAPTGQPAAASRARTTASGGDTLSPAYAADSAAARAREAGGPIDRASYVCLCGFVFAAAVSTTVECPHCGAPQAW